MPVQRYNAEMAGLQSSQFQGRAEPQFAWQKTMSMYQMLPGLRGFWPMSAFWFTALTADFSMMGNTLTYNGNPTYNLDGLVPYIDLDGTGDYLSRADNSNFDISGTETYVAAGLRGLTIGCWFYPEDDASNDAVMAKWGGAPQRSYLLYAAGAAANDPLVFYISDDGTNSDSATNINTTYNEWNFGVGRFNDADTGEQLALWVNDDKQTAATARNSISNSNANFTIGANHAGGDLFTGNIALAFLCASALPDYMINALYDHTKTMFGHV